MFVIYPQAAQTQHPTVDSIEKVTCVIDFLNWLSINILKSSIKIKFHTFWVQIASFFGGFVVLLCLSNLLLLFFYFLILRSPLNWFIKQSKGSDSKWRHPTNSFRFTKYRIAIPLFRLFRWALHEEINAPMKFFPYGFVMHHARRTKWKRGY